MELQTPVRRRAAKALQAQAPSDEALSHDLIRRLVREMVAEAMAAAAPTHAQPPHRPSLARAPPLPLDPMLALSEVSLVTGLSKSAIYMRVKDGRFPPPLKLSTRCARWRRSTIEAFLSDAEQVA